MKVKEIPPSLYHSARLLSIPANRLKTRKAGQLPVVVSMTTIPSRLNKLSITIRSILDQSAQPEKVVLWLHESIRGNIPQSLQILEGELFEIRYSKLDCSHLKLVESLRAFPDRSIITSDDDYIYDRDWLRILYDEHLKHPNSVVAVKSRLVRFDENGNVLPYKEWNYDRSGEYNKNAVLPIGSAGVLYPPHCFHELVTDEALFMKLAPKADDLWFKVMSYLNGTSSIETSVKPKSQIPVMGTQFESLKKQNIGQDKNRDQWLALTKYFNITL